MTPPENFDYHLAQSQRALEAATADSEANRAIANSVSWAEIALRRMAKESDIPVTNAAALIVAAVNLHLNLEIMKLPEESPEAGD